MSKRIRDVGIGDYLHPKIDLNNLLETVDSHSCRGDMILEAVLDIAEIGRRDAEDRGNLEENSRFISIMDFIQMYRAGQSNLFQKISREQWKRRELAENVIPIGGA